MVFLVAVVIIIFFKETEISLMNIKLRRGKLCFLDDFIIDLDCLIVVCHCHSHENCLSSWISTYLFECYIPFFYWLLTNVIICLMLAEFFPAGDIASLVYLWNPFTIVACVGLSTSPIENLAIVLTLYGASKGKKLAIFAL